jgi:type IV secretion system protein VirD4
MLNPDLAAACLPGPGQQFDIDRFILTGGTLYLLARTDTEDSVLGPLFAALASEIHERALQLASRMRGGRLQPPVTMILDEVCRIAPVPLPAWGADSAGQGVLIWSGFQSIAQLKARWGEHGAQTVLDTSTVKIITPGVTDPVMLEHLSRLCGRVSYRLHKTDESWQFTEAMSESMIRQLPDGFALIIRANCAVLIARLAAGWKYGPFRRLARAGLAVAPVIPAAKPLTIDGTGLVIDDDGQQIPPATKRPWRQQPEGGEA